jgi:hypothetical protein
MRWQLGSDRFGVHLSVDTEPAEGGPAALFLAIWVGGMVGCELVVS